MRRIAIAVITVSALASFADEPKTPQDRVSERQASIEKMKEHDRAEAYAKLSLDLVELAYAQYKAGEIVAGHRTIAAVGETAVKALDAAKMKSKKVKEAEINLRRCSRRLDEIRRAVDVVDQRPINEAIATVDKARSGLLEAMFAKK